MEETEKKTFKFKITNILIILVAATLAITLVNSYFVFSSGFAVADTDTGGLKQVQPTVNQPTQPSKVEVSVDNDAVKGSANAPITIIEFGDYECPFCARFFDQTLPSIQTNYIDTGKVRLVYRDFPLNDIHSNAQKAAEAAECAGEQDKYWEMHDKLFEEGVMGGIATFKSYASQLGLDTATFDTCLDSSAMASEVSKDMNEGASYGVTGTPAFFVNGILVSGAQPFSVFQGIIEEELKK